MVFVHHTPYMGWLAQRKYFARQPSRAATYSHRRPGLSSHHGGGAILTVGTIELLLLVAPLVALAAGRFSVPYNVGLRLARSSPSFWHPFPSVVLFRLLIFSLLLP